MNVDAILGPLPPGLFQIALEASSVGIFIVDRRGIIRWVNPAFTEMTGYSLEEAVGKNPRLLRSGHHTREFYQRLWTTILAGQIWHDELLNRRKDGRLYNEEQTITPIRGEGGEVEFFIGVKRDVSARKRDAALLRRSETEYQHLFEKMLDGCALHEIICDSAGNPVDYRYLAVNPAFEQLTGLKARETVGRRVLEILPNIEPFWIETYGRVALTGEAAHFERYQPELDKYFEVAAYRPGEGQFAVVFADITARKRHELALQESERRMRSVIENSAAGYFFIDTLGRYQIVNDAWLKMHGYTSAEEVLGKHYSLSQTREDLFAANAVVGRVLQQRQVSAGEFSRLRKDGSVGFHTYTATPVYRQGELIGLEGFLIDTTERREAEERLRASERRLRSYFDSTLIGFAIAGAGMEWIEVNDRFCEFLGYSRDELCRMNSVEVTHPDDREKDDAAVGRIAAGDIEGYSVEKRYVRKDGGTLHAEISVRCVRRPQGGVDYFVVLVRDLSDRKRLEAELLQSQKLESVGRLAGGVAHDFNNLLTVINGYADLVLRQLGQRNPIYPQVAEIRNAGERATDLTRQLIAFSRKQILQPRVVEINQVIGDNRRLVDRLIGDDVELSAVLDPRAGRVKVDAGQLNQVLINLAANARQAMPGGGKLTIETAAAELDQAYASLHPEVSPGRYAMIAVSDTGRGMSQAALQHLFEPFFTDKEGGTGLGLSTVYGIVRQSGGHIWVYSEPGRGTTFKIYLPQVDGDTSSPEAQTPAAGGHSGSETILVAEDHPEVRLLVRHALESSGYRVLDAVSGASALEICGQHPAPIHLLLTDVVMPGLSGIDLAAQVSKLRPGMKVLFMSGYAENAIVRHGVLDAGVPLIQKPFSPDALAARVRELLDGN